MKKDKIKINLEGTDLSCFDENQQKAVLEIAQGVANQVSDAANQPAINEYNDLSTEANELLMKDSQKATRMANVWKNNGVIPGLKERVTMDELITHSKKWHNEFATQGADAGFASTDHPFLIERAISQVVKEAVEPNIVLTPMLTKIGFQHGTQLTFPAMGAFHAADIPEGGEYPERSLDFAGQTTATIGKSGVAVKVTEEMVRYSQFDVVGLHLTAAGRALTRWKEEKVKDMIIDNAGGANTLMDNSASGTAFKSTTGRDALGAYNGTFTLDDLFYAWAQMTDRGFTANTLLMNPFAWQIFADEGVSRAFGFINGLSMWGNTQGSPAALPQFNGPSPLLTQQQPTGPENIATTMTNVPSLFPSPFNIVVTPYMPFDSTTNRTDIIFCDRNELGLLVVDEEVTTDQFNDPARDILKIKLRERYGLASMNNGAGTGIIKSVSLAKSFDFSRSVSLDLTTGDMGSQLTLDSGNTAEV